MSMHKTGLHLFPPRSRRSQIGSLNVLLRLFRWFFRLLNLWFELNLIRLDSLNSLGSMDYIAWDSASSQEYFFRTLSILLFFVKEDFIFEFRIFVILLVILWIILIIYLIYSIWRYFWGEELKLIKLKYCVFMLESLEWLYWSSVILFHISHS
jgi:hypothetical protein